MIFWKIQCWLCAWLWCHTWLDRGMWHHVHAIHCWLPFYLSEFENSFELYTYIYIYICVYLALLSRTVYLSMYIYIYMYIYVYNCIYIYICILYTHMYTVIYTSQMSFGFLSDLPFFEVPKQVPHRRPLAKLQQHIKTLAPAVSIASQNHKKPERYLVMFDICIYNTYTYIDHLLIILHVLFDIHDNWGSLSPHTRFRSNIQAQHQVSTGIATSCECCRFGPSLDMHATRASSSESDLGYYITDSVFIAWSSR